MAGLLGQKGVRGLPSKPPVFYGLVAPDGTALSLLLVNPLRLLVLRTVFNGIAARASSWSCGVSGSRRLMGGYVHGNAARVLGWLTATVVAAAAFSMFAPARIGM